MKIEDTDDTMQQSAEALAEAVIGHRIVSVEERRVRSQDWWRRETTATVITLDNGKEVRLLSNDDCCAYTELEAFLLHPDKVDHIITGVGTTDDYMKWHIYADMGDVLNLTVGWSEGSGYYAYGFDIEVVEVED